MLNQCPFINIIKKRCFKTHSEQIFVRSYGFLLILVSELITFNNYCNQDPVTPTITHSTITITHYHPLHYHYHPLSPSINMSQTQIMTQQTMVDSCSLKQAPLVAGLHNFFCACAWQVRTTSAHAL